MVKAASFFESAPIERTGCEFNFLCSKFLNFLNNFRSFKFQVLIVQLSLTEMI